MMPGKTAGFREREHTADWELEVWAPDLTALLEQAALGMYQLSGAELQEGDRLERSISLPFQDREGLIVSFLSELLYLGEVEGLGFDSFDIQLTPEQLKARLYGAPLESMSKQIKAVTYHNLQVRQGRRGLEARIVFDV